VAQAIVGLGNPGPEYRNTRHNVGHRVLEELARRLHARFSREGGHAVARAGWRDETLYLVKPESFMNVSGTAVARLCRRLHLAPSDLIVVFDDLDLPLGKVRVRIKGSAGGHNGVRSLIEALGTDAFRRVKIGIGRPAPPGQQKHLVVDHVLSGFDPDEQEIITKARDEAADRALKLVEARAIGPAA
jgi:peptidyl-tRNA hydrolase, PTH1 family